MSEMPSKVIFHEVGPREGFQFEKQFIPTERKLELVNALADSGVSDIEVTSFVHPKWVPVMADAEAVSAALRPVPGLRYSCLYLNAKGLQRAAATGKYYIDGSLKLTASPAFAKKNTNKTLDEAVAAFEEFVVTYRQIGVPIEQATVSCAWGCNYQGDVPHEWVIDRISTVESVIEREGSKLKRILVADTMGWATPDQIRKLLVRVRNRWPEAEVRVHLHDTRGPGVANTLAAMECGVAHIDSAVAGLGGCPFAGHAAAAGNVCTEDLVFICHEMGIETGIDLEKLAECGRLAEDIVGHPLPGKIMKAGTLNGYRKAAAAAAA